jgi:hypothetical protein
MFVMSDRANSWKERILRRRHWQVDVAAAISLVLWLVTLSLWVGVSQGWLGNGVAGLGPLGNWKLENIFGGARLVGFSDALDGPFFDGIVAIAGGTGSMSPARETGFEWPGLRYRGVTLDGITWNWSMALSLGWLALGFSIVPLHWAITRVRWRGQRRGFEVAERGT